MAPEARPIIHVEHLGGSRSIDHWRADLREARSGDLQASASVVLTARRPTDAHDQWTMPEALEPHTLEEFHAPGTQGQQTDIRRLSGTLLLPMVLHGLWDSSLFLSVATGVEPSMSQFAVYPLAIVCVIAVLRRDRAAQRR